MSSTIEKFESNSKRINQFDVDVIRHLQKKLLRDNVIEIPDYIENGHTITGKRLNCKRINGEYSWKSINSDDPYVIYITKCIKYLRIRTKEQFEVLMKLYNEALFYDKYKPNESFDIEIYGRKIRTTAEYYEEQTEIIKRELNKIPKKTYNRRISMILDKYVFMASLANRQRFLYDNAGNAVKTIGFESIHYSNIGFGQIHYYKQMNGFVLIGVIPIKSTPNCNINRNGCVLTNTRRLTNKSFSEIFDNIIFYKATPKVIELLIHKPTNIGNILTKPISIVRVRVNGMEYYREATELEIKRSK